MARQTAFVERKKKKQGEKKKCENTQDEKRTKKKKKYLVGERASDRTFVMRGGYQEWSERGEVEGGSGEAEVRGGHRVAGPDFSRADLPFALVV